MTHTNTFGRKASQILAGVSALAVLSGMGAGQAAAQESGYEEIIVTARRAEESLQDVPATVAVFTQSTLEMVNATTAEDVIELTPGVTIVTNTAEVGDTQINIRGINGARDGESSVALVVDGILKTNTSVLNQVQNNLQQIEILKGPQGAYYGRNAAAGALVMSTKKPGDEWEFAGQGSFGNNATVSTALTASGPITGTTGILIGADYSETDGFFRNTGPNAEANGATVDQYRGFTLQARLVSELSDDISLDVKTRYGEVESGAINYNVTFQLPNTAAAFGSPQFNGDVNEQNFTYLSNIASDGNQDTFELSAKVDWALADGAFDLTFWGLYSDVNQELFADGAVAAFGFFNTSPECIQSNNDLFAAGQQLPAPLFFAPDVNNSILGAFGPTTCDGTQYQVRNQEDVSFEIRLASDTGTALNYSVGAYYLHIDRQVGVSIGYDRGQGILPNLFNGPETSNPTEQLADDSFTTDVIALFGSATYDITDTLTFDAALRWDREKRAVSNNVPVDARNQFIRGGGVPLNIGLDATGSIPDQDEVFSEIQPRVSVAWKPLDTFTAFASWGVGFKSGGFNNQGSAATIESVFNLPAVNANLNITDNFRKETSSAFEIGVKGSLLDNRIQYELAGYYTKIDDMQFFEFFAGPFGILRVVSNIDEVEVLGVEGSMNARLSDTVNIFGGFNINDSEINANGARPGTEGGKSPYTPDYTLNAGIDITQPISDSLDLTMRLDYRRVGPTWFHTVQEGNRPTLFNLVFGSEFLGTGNFSQSKRNAYDVINLRGGIQAENWSLIAFVENLAESEYLDEVIPAPEFGGSFTSPGGRRSYGIQARFNF